MCKIVCSPPKRKEKKGQLEFLSSLPYRQTCGIEQREGICYVPHSHFIKENPSLQKNALELQDNCEKAK